MVRERGEGKFGLILFLAVIALIVFFALKYVPPRLNAYEFKEFVEQTALQAPYDQRTTADSIRRSLLEKAHELNLPVEEEDIEVQRSGESCTINVIVRVPIDFKVKKHVLVVDCSAKSKAV